MTATPTPDDGAALLSSIIECLLRAQRALEPIITTRLAIEGFPKDATAIGEARVAVDAAVEAWNTRSPAPVSGEAFLPLADLLYIERDYSAQLGSMADGPNLKSVERILRKVRKAIRQHCAGVGREGAPTGKI